MSKPQQQRRYVDYAFVRTNRPIASPKDSSNQDTFNGGKQDARNARSGFRFFFEGPMLCIEWPPTRTITDVPLASIAQATRWPETEEEAAAS